MTKGWDFLPYASGLVAVGCIAGSVKAWKLSNRVVRLRRWAWRGLASSGLLLALVGSILAGASFWYTHRVRPEPARRRLFEGVDYLREVRDSPRPLVIHVIKVDLKAEGIRFLVTPADRSGGRALRARKTTDFLDEFGLQVAINANDFYPFATKAPWDYYPRPGDPVDVCGIAASNGSVYSAKPWTEGTFYLSERNEASFERPIGRVENAIAGNGYLLRDGRIAGPFADHDLYPRGALALDRMQRSLILVVVDGKQPHYNEGCSLEELASILIDLGGHDAIRVDEGGSATLASEGPDGRPLLLNCPINSRIPGFERPVANHLGIFARP